MATQAELNWQLAVLPGAVAAWKACAAALPAGSLKLDPLTHAVSAVCEATAETGWGQHEPPGSLNVLGIKHMKGDGWTGKVVGADGTEQNPNGSWTGKQPDMWRVYPTYEACFADQCRILQEPRYRVAMASVTAEGYIQAECETWSTSQAKGTVVTGIFVGHGGTLLAAAKQIP